MADCRCKNAQKKEQEKLQEKQLDECFARSNCVSARDCTGTVVSAPKNEDQKKNYEEKYHFEPEKVVARKN